MTQLNRKTRIILVGAAGLLAVAAIIVALYLMVWAPPTKQDFTDAKASAEKITTYKGSELLSKFVVKINEQSRAGLTQQKLADSAAEEKKKAVDAVTARAELAKELQASRIVRDEQVKKTYDTYAAKEAKYRVYITGYADVYPAYKSSFDTCVKVFQINDGAANDLTKLAGLHRTASKTCFEDLAIVEKSSITPLANYAKEFHRIIDERQKTFDGIEKKTLDTDKAGDRIKELGADFSKNDPTEALQKFISESRFDGELTALIKLLDDKAKAAK